MTRKQWRMERIRAIGREYEVAPAAAKGLGERFRKNPSELEHEGLQFRDYMNYCGN